MNDYNNYYPQQNESFLIKMAYKLGAKNRKQAETLLLVLTIVALALAVYLYFGFATPQAEPIMEP